MTPPNGERPGIGHSFDVTFRALHGVPDVTMSPPATRQSVSAVLELAQTFIIQTARHRERGDTIFVQYIGADGHMRIALPPEVAACIARQREALTVTNRKRAARAEAARRKAAGIKPGFLSNPGTGGRGARKARKARKAGKGGKARKGGAA